MSLEQSRVDLPVLEILRYFAILVWKLEKRLMYDQKQLAEGELCYLACEALDRVCRIKNFQICVIDPIFLELQPWSVEIHISLCIVGQGMRIRQDVL